MLASLILSLGLASACQPLPGAATVWRPQVRLVMVGEVHGTREAPAVAAALLCQGRRDGRPVTLALEAAPAEGQAELDRYLRSAGSAADLAALRAAPMWRDRNARGSEAVLGLVEVARREGVRVALFDTTPAKAGPTDAGREQGMATALAQLAAQGRVVVLTGLGHADRGGFASLKPFVPSAVQWLPPESAVTLAPIMTGGEAWACRTDGCKAYPLPVRRPVRPAGVVLDPTLRGGFDGGYAVGGQFSASPPAHRD